VAVYSKPVIAELNALFFGIKDGKNRPFFMDLALSKSKHLINIEKT
jgi:hypothetical protein